MVIFNDNILKVYEVKKDFGKLIGILLVIFTTWGILSFFLMWEGWGRNFSNFRFPFHYLIKLNGGIPPLIFLINRPLT